MILLIFLILILFSSVFVGVWFWFYKNETLSCKDFYKQGMKAFKNKNYEKAKDLFSQAFSLDFKFENVEYMLGVSLLSSGDCDNARKCFENILNSSPQNFNALFSMAQIMQKDKNYNEAEEFYNKALAENDKDSECYFNLGIISYKKQDYAKALELFEKTKELSPKNIQASSYITMCQGELCNFEREKFYKNIIKEYTKIAGRKDLPKEFGISLAKVYAKAGEANKALSACKKILASDSENVETYKLLGLIQLIKKDFTEAKNALSTAINLQPKDREVYEILSYLLCQQKDVCDRQKCREKYYEMVKKFL